MSFPCALNVYFLITGLGQSINFALISIPAVKRAFHIKDDEETPKDNLEDVKFGSPVLRQKVDDNLAASSKATGNKKKKVKKQKN